MSKIIIPLLMIFLVSCRSAEQRIICQQIQAHQIKALPLCDPSWQFDRCRCRCFDYNKWEATALTACPRLATKDDYDVVKRISEGGKVVSVIDKPLIYCDGIAGFFLEDAAQEIRPHIKALAQIKNNLCQ